MNDIVGLADLARDDRGGVPENTQEKLGASGLFRLSDGSANDILDIGPPGQPRILTITCKTLLSGTFS